AMFAVVFVQKPMKIPTLTRAWKLVGLALLGVGSGWIAVAGGGGAWLALGIAGVSMGLLAWMSAAFGPMQSVYAFSRLGVLCIAGYLVAVQLHEMMFAK